MFVDVREQEILVKIKQYQKIEQVLIKIIINEDNHVNAVELYRSIKQIIDIQENLGLFYYDLNKETYAILQEEDMLHIPYARLANQNGINILVEQKMSDQLQANSPIKSKRSPERQIYQAFQIVKNWRCLYHKGLLNQKGQPQKVTLERSARISGVPKKSLQDYYLLLRNGYNLGFNFGENCRNKIGVLRNYVKQRKKVKAEQITEKQKIKNQKKYDEIILMQIQKQIDGRSEKDYQDELFRVVSPGSDEDEVNEMVNES